MIETAMSVRYHVTTIATANSNDVFLVALVAMVVVALVQYL